MRAVDFSKSSYEKGAEFCLNYNTSYQLSEIIRLNSPFAFLFLLSFPYTLTLF